MFVSGIKRGFEFGVILMADNLFSYSAPPISLTGLNRTEADTRRAEAVVAALEIIRAAIIRTGATQNHMNKLTTYADSIEAALKSRQE